MASLNQPSDDYSGFRKWHHGQIEEGQDEKYDLYDSNAQSAVYKNSVFADSADMSAVNNVDGNNSTMISPNSGAVRKTSVMSHLFGSVVVDGLEDEAGANNNNNPDSTRSRKDDFSSFFDATQSPHHFDKQANPEEEEGEQVLPEGDGEEEQQESAALVSYLSWLEEQQSNSQHLDDDDDDDDHPMIVPLRHPRDLAMREAQREDSRPNSPGGSVGSGSGRNPMHILFRNNNNNNAANGDNASVGRGDTTSYI